MDIEDNIKELFTKMEAIHIQLENVRLQQLRFASDRESEKGTMARIHSQMDDQIDKIERTFNETIFDREKGIAFILDRLLEKDKKREESRKQIIGLWIAVGIMVIKMVFDLFNSK